ncbi:hypothetical protein [Streptomyces hirsutus]|uniref:hypothetical protein n=1 Tax=Streptomyces hirsutus TaxID=35620 RepID=UPI0036C8318B
MIVWQSGGMDFVVPLPECAGFKTLCPDLPGGAAVDDVLERIPARRAELDAAEERLAKELEAVRAEGGGTRLRGAGAHPAERADRS